MIVLIAVILMALLCGIALLVRSSNYTQAIQMVEQEAFDEAATKFASLGNYRESPMYLDYCLLREAVIQKDWASAASSASKISGFLNADLYGRLCSGADLYQNGHYDDAIGILDDLPELPEAAELRSEIVEKMREADYEQAQQYMDEELWDEAIALLDSLGDYQESSFLMNACQQNIKDGKYEAATRMMEAGRYEDAIAALTELGTYADSPVLLLVCQDKIKQQIYDSAVSAYASGIYDEAYEKFVTLEDYKDSLLYCRWIEAYERSARE